MSPGEGACNRILPPLQYEQVGRRFKGVRKEKLGQEKRCSMSQTIQVRMAPLPTKLLSQLDTKTPLLPTLKPMSLQSPRTSKALPLSQERKGSAT